MGFRLWPTDVVFLRCLRRPMRSSWSWWIRSCRWESWPCVILSYAALWYDRSSGSTWMNRRSADRELVERAFWGWKRSFGCRGLLFWRVRGSLFVTSPGMTNSEERVKLARPVLSLRCYALQFRAWIDSDAGCGDAVIAFAIFYSHDLDRYVLCAYIKSWPTQRTDFLFLC